ncbi:MAG: cardiolipin synthase [Candidatus Competibacteraceae bacterium]|uniref:Cardiolipin synthase n=1 Tax=Candidatus Contendobacter odensis Run_B_J11 TaxID=1400861 RepID=A0A7U7G957_9GAMM|nr:cardiolipin synthase [Candidatus Contendobacter odensis]MBK8536961.1 cardiolipin synthase [Candidatus Competibacteraceae bacterium]MBK8751037.1 cardiolipin synthase [Candidatus Competibacteraceae bacterium]CDH44207.1 putative Cardiolipin synthase [Candidatus Contendobacter odensis Run_B_J11]
MTEPLIALLSLAWLLWIALVAVGLILERRSPTATLAWLLALLFMPYFGFLVYLLFGPRRLHRRRRRYGRARARLIQSTHHLRPGYTPSGFPTAGLERQLARLLERLGQGALSPATAVTVLESGDACFQALETAIVAAQHHVHLEYYLWQPDRVGTRLRDLLIEKARAGIAVRLLLDPMGSNRISRRFLQPLRDAGGMTAWFNPLRLRRLRPNHVNFRTHRKIVVCDGRIGFIGGINVSDAHSTRCSGVTAWRDTHLRIEGEPVHRLHFIFLEDWYFATDHAPFQPEFFPQFPPHSAGPWLQIVESGPDNDRYAIAQCFFAAISGAQRQVLLSTPYFVPNEALNMALRSAALRGVEVKLLTPKRSDSRLVTAAAHSYYDELISAGVLIHQYGPPMLHTKLLVIDERIAAIGSANFDHRSLALNFEVVAVLYDAGLAIRLARSFSADLRQAQRYVKPGRRASLGQRLAEATARLLSPLL